MRLPRRIGRSSQWRKENGHGKSSPDNLIFKIVTCHGMSNLYFQPHLVPQRGMNVYSLNIIKGIPPLRGVRGVCLYSVILSGAFPREDFINLICHCETSFFEVVAISWVISYYFQNWEIVELWIWIFKKFLTLTKVRVFLHGFLSTKIHQFLIFFRLTSQFSRLTDSNKWDCHVA